MLEVYFRHGMIGDKNHEAMSVRQSWCLEKFNILKTQKRNQAVNDLEKVCYEILNNAFSGNAMENKQKCVILEIIKKDGDEKSF